MHLIERIRNSFLQIPSCVVTILILFSIFYTGCSNSSDSDKIKKLEKENTELRQQISELEKKFDTLSCSSTNMLAEANKALEQKEWDKSILIANKLKQQYPLSPESSFVNQLISTAQKALDAEISAANEIKEKQEKEQNEKLKRQAAALHGLTKRFDKVEEITWYTPQSGSGFKDAIYLYIGVKKNYSWLRLAIRYHGDWWLFIKDIDIKIDNEPSYKYTPQNDLQHENSTGSVWEVIDDEFNSSINLLINKIIDSKSTIIRFNGRDNKIHDFTVTKQMKADLRKVLDAHTAIKAE